MPTAPVKHRPASSGAPRHQVQRPSSAKRMYGYKWQQARDGFLARHPLCAYCEVEGRVTPATVVDHIKSHRNDPALFWNRANWQPLCKRHHDIKTARDDGGFGNPTAADQGRGA